MYNIVERKRSLKEEYILSDKNNSNVKHASKDGLFRDLFSEVVPFIQLYKTLSGKELREDEIVRFDLSSELLNREEYNDVSFLTKDNRLIILIEHQSTPNENMPMRLNIYYCNLIKLWLMKNERTLYGERDVGLPKPEFYVAYNGKKELSSKHLSFKSRDLQVSVEVLDIRYHKLENKNESNYLAGYSFFIDTFEQKRAEIGDIDTAFEYARQQCIERGYLQGVVEKEEFMMYSQLFSKEAEQKALLLDALAEGRSEGKSEGIETMLAMLIKDGMAASQIDKLAREAGVEPRRLAEIKSRAVPIEAPSVMEAIRAERAGVNKPREKSQSTPKKSKRRNEHDL